MAEAKSRERVSVTGQRDRSLLLLVRHMAKVTGLPPLRAAGAIMELVCEPAAEPTYEEEHAVAIVKAAISPPRRGAADDDEEDEEEL